MADYPSRSKDPNIPEEKPEMSQKVAAHEEPEQEQSDSFNPIQIEAESEEEQNIRQDKIVADLSSKFNDWDTWRKPYEDTWNTIYKLYLNIQDVIKTPTRAKVFVPIVFQIIEATVSKLSTVIFGQEDYFDVVPVVKKDMPLADVIKILLRYQLAQADFFMKFMDFVKQLAFYGTSYLKVYWKVTRKWVFERTPIRQDVSIMGFKLGSRITGWKEERVYKTTERRPEVDVLDILDVFPQPDAPNEKEAEGVFLRSWISFQELQQMSKGKYPIYKNTEDPLLTGGDTQWSSSRGTRLSARGSSSPASISKDRVELLEWWGLYDLDGDGIREECQIVIANRKVVIRAMCNPFHHQKKPIIRAVLFPIPLEWYGMGMIEPVIPLIYELNTLRRQRLDNVIMAINRMWKVLSYSDIDLETLVSSPNGLILTDDMASIEALETNDVTSSAYSEAQIVQSDIEQTTTPKSMQGVPQGGSLGRTARGAQMIIGQAMEKFSTASRMIEDMAICRLLRMFHQLNLQFIDNDETFQDPGLYGHVFDREVTPEMIRAEVQFKMMGISDMMSKEAKINQAISFMGVFGKILSGISIESVAKKVWSLMGFNDDDIVIQGMEQQIPPTPQGDVNQMMQNPEAAAQVQTNGAGGPPAISQ